MPPNREAPAGSTAWRERGLYYVGLGVTWLLLAWLAIRTGNRGGSTAMGGWNATWSYLLTQGLVIWRYLRLAFWPHPLIFDYGPELSGGLHEVFWPLAAWAGLGKRALWLLGALAVAGAAGTWLQRRERKSGCMAAIFRVCISCPHVAILL